MERRKYSIEVKTPVDCDADELQDFAKLIEEGGEVADGVEERLKDAYSLGLVHYEKKLVGTAALKKPAHNYRKAVFEKARASVEPGEFSRELGWIFLKEEHRSKGQIQPLIETLLKVAGTHGTFATTRVSNDKMNRILMQQKFVHHGESYASTQNDGEEIVLYIRPGSTRKAKAN